MPPRHDPHHIHWYSSKQPEGYGEIIRGFRESPQSDPSVIDRINIEQMFILIDSILPIEACLYYQVLPLFLEGNYLNLGMVARDDDMAVDYVRRIVSYLNYSLITHSITSESLRTCLTAYLRYTDEKSKTQALPEPSTASRRVKRLSDRENTPLNVDAGVQPTLIVDGPDTLDLSERVPEDLPDYSRDWSIDDASTITIGLFDESAIEWDRADAVSLSPDPGNQKHSPHSEQASIQPELEKRPELDEKRRSASPKGDSDDDIDFPSIPDLPDLDEPVDAESLETVDRTPTIPSALPLDNTPLDIPVPDDTVPDPIISDDLRSGDANWDAGTRDDEIDDETQDETQNDARLSKTPADEAGLNEVLNDARKPPAFIPSVPRGLLRSPLKLELSAGDRRIPLETLHTLPAHDLLQELLVRVLEQGIGRLYFERNQQTGRILWSESGVVQSVVEHLSDNYFTEVLEELKRITRLALKTTDKPLQIELERMYQNERLLLRFRFIPTKYGQEATLQVLRGAALRFYQQQQLSKLSHDALSTAQALQVKVNAIRDRMLAASDPSGPPPSLTPALTRMIDQIEAQLEALRQPQSHPPSEKRPYPQNDADTPEA